MKRYRIVIEGEVQQIGYREYIKKCAQKLKIKGCTRNLPDGEVEVYCALSPEHLENFKNLILHPEIIPVKIENVIVYSEDETKYGTPPCDFTTFKVIRDEDEVAETLSVMTAAGVNLLKLSEENLSVSKETLEVSKKTLEVSKKTLEVSKETLEVSKETSEAVKLMHQDMVSCFSNIDRKYGEFGERMSRLEEDMREIKEILARFVEHYIQKNTK